ncbi:MAG: 2-phosphosulfolactate phosphatase [Thiomonas sp.]
MQKVHVLSSKEELDAERLDDHVVIVLDVLFATTSALAALQAGASVVIPALDAADALRIAAGLDGTQPILSGELNAETLSGFAHPTPLTLLRHDLRDRALIYSTTNGTVALRKAQTAAQVYAASLRNAQATIDHVLRTQGQRTVLLVCAGSAGKFNLEDFYGAGLLVSALQQAPGERSYSDAAIAAALLQKNSPALQCLRESRVGRLMQCRNLEEEVHYAAQTNADSVVAQLRDGRLVRV